MPETDPLTGHPRVHCPECGWHYPPGTVAVGGELLDPVVESGGQSAHPRHCSRSESPWRSGQAQGLAQFIPHSFANKKATQSVSTEPRRMGSQVRDVDGHVWVRNREMWVCTAPVGTTYLETRTRSDGTIVRRMQTITRVGRLRWHNLLDYGPLEMVEK